jgi:hypothetical protein
MGRASRKSAACICAILVITAGLFAVPAGSGLAARQSTALPARKSTALPARRSAPKQTAVVNQIVALDNSGHVDVYGLSNSTLQLFWQSPSEGWLNFATGDFDAGGYDEIVAMNTNTLQLFCPLTGAAGTCAGLNATFTAPGTLHLLATGDFQGYGYKQVVFTYLSGGQEVADEWNPKLGTAMGIDTENYGWQAIVTGKLQTVNDDVVLMRNADWVSGGPDHYIAAFAWNYMPNTNTNCTAGQWCLEFRQGDPENGNLDTGFCCDWITGAIGQVVNKPWSLLPTWDTLYNVTTLPNPLNELVLARQFSASNAHTELFWYAGGWLGTTSTVTAPSINWTHDLTNQMDPNYTLYTHDPAFAKIALANLNGDPNGFKEVVGVREFPTGNALPANWAFIVTLNPNSEPGIPQFQVALDPSDYVSGNQWYQLAAGDLTGNGEDQIVVERGTDLRVYYQPIIDTSDVDLSGSFSTAALAVANVGFGNLGILDVGPAVLNYSLGCGAVSPAQGVAIANQLNTGVLDWQAQTSSPWIILNQTSGTTPYTLDVSVDATQGGTQAGQTNTGTIQITAVNPSSSTPVVNGSQTVTVHFNQIAPALSVTPASGLSLSDAPWGQQTSGSLALSNSASGAPLAWSAQVVGGSLIDWLTISPPAGSTPGSLGASVYPHDVGEVGPLAGYIHIQAQDACNATLTQDVSVSANVPDPGMVALQHEITLWQILNGAAPSQNITIVSPGGDSIQWSASAFSGSDAGRVRAAVVAALKKGTAHITAKGLQMGTPQTTPAWLSFSPTSGTSSSQPESIQVTVNTNAESGLGTYSATIVVVPTNPTNPNWVQVIPVTLLVVNQIYQNLMPVIAN